MNSNEVSSLDALTFPLRGSQLIEASAGTGKTYTIAALYVRLVLGHGGAEYAFAKALTPPEILVVTFTEAATKELRDRIRARLAEASRLFLADPASVSLVGTDADVLLNLRAETPLEHWAGCARKLQLAAEWMDEAAVSTIHSWCNRMLREHAFDSSSLFTQKLETDQSELLAEVVRDYWRTFIVPLGEKEALEVNNNWSGPEELQKTIRSLIAHADLLQAAPAPAISIAQVANERLDKLSALKKPWHIWADGLAELFEENVANFNARQFNAKNRAEWMKIIRHWRDTPELIAPALSDAAKHRLCNAGMAEIWRINPVIIHDGLDALDRLDDELASLPVIKDIVLRHAAGWVAARFAQEQLQRAQMGFDDLLTRLDHVLKGPNGARLAARIREKFPVALIDEFQDTDPVQYRIFNAVYRIEENSQESALILIGDPKQAIYAFRGADIFTYLAARRACTGRLHTLKRNFRSTDRMVDAVNRCFSRAENRTEGAGAFMFKNAQDNPVPFVEADAQGRKESLVIAGKTAAALTVWYLPNAANGKAMGIGEYLSQMAAACATEMVALLNLGQTHQAGFAEIINDEITEKLGEEIKPLRPRDMAVLVNNGHEAEAIRSALAARNVRSVYLSDRDSVFASAQAEEIQYWLAACAEPEESRLVRAALATPTLGLTWQTLERMNHDEAFWEECVVQFKGYRDLWRAQGVLPMLRRILHDYAVAEQLLQQRERSRNNPSNTQTNGERILTDLLHLAELLQNAAQLLEGEHALIRYLAEQRNEQNTASGDGDNRQIRLESDADLIQVVTVHKSKGLEYPLVFLPFACTLRATKPNDCPFKLHDESGNLQILLSADKAAVARVDRERQGEDLRKLYVALTRARHAIWVGVAPTDNLHLSAFGYLLATEKIEPSALENRLQELAGGASSIVVAAAPTPSATQFSPLNGSIALGKALSMPRSVREHWWVASYSALRTTAAAVRRAEKISPDSAQEDVFTEGMQASEYVLRLPTANPKSPSASGLLHALPRGAEVGTFLHDLLEWAADKGFAILLKNPEWLRETLTRRCTPRGWQQWIEPLHEWLQQFLNLPFRIGNDESDNADSFSLVGLAEAVAEMEFWLAAEQVNAEEIDKLVCQYTLAALPRPALVPNRLNGMLKGFIDLVFAHQGRYYVADYKSNWLGENNDAYSEDAMRAEILHHRYDLQYALYLLALHRLLKSRLPDYDYDEHVGGAVYLFLRGSQAPSQGLHFEKPSKVLIESLDAIFSGQRPQQTLSNRTEVAA